MSDSIVKCDGCGQPGRRRADHPCPDHWFYLVSEDAKDGTVYIVWACSEACRDGQWKRGPGPTNLIEDTAVSQEAVYRRRREMAAEQDLVGDIPTQCTSPGCQREDGHVGQHKSRSWEGPPNGDGNEVIEEWDDNGNREVFR